MKFISYAHGGRESFGLVEGEGIIDLPRLLGNRYPDLKSLIAADALAQAREAARGRAADVALDAVTFLPVIPNPGKIWCAGLNYGEHVRETGREVPERPMYFLRVADSQVGHGQAILRPPESERLDFEGEIAVIIGREGRRIEEADAWTHIAGYACYNDASIRDWQLHTSQWGPGKNFFATGGFGPWMVSADEIEPDAEMTLVTRLNGTEVQRATTRMLIHSIPRLISYASTVAPLRAGDVIVTGTPGGVGAKRTPPLWMKDGDVVEVEVDRIGILRNRVKNESK
ncbi:2-keto-4-pentenoate hydratase/2-oxohepta-3-ene-1,7-dioic acid hydratase in catechol pathway [Variovorax boronicumulans]|uniref:fumarylacetoacetate hydrolase family protein n=1 Tax=Variovorax boronicumulans TaxID=436515 RepID=UPI0027865447|nr:fumarylacetoacetate hydrolase family protein [Variovorax boronicumulans]MDP9995735.1 2-keto-4-pentenoate hydratase/2-oxohepta-3-ene-1,7-dioic acid hydratase in catechol pathway [Variovorax boronicumulans]MDQ0006800.1 2-keto-4-pentenoate hydratase/2-oxohepta-3-ene-1,7-dioic acid hydratase in catechol pathway [Variovorax boronicumulans]MDQ0036747.1 2-keto-4-pentenoate hydratase/2-oxohepta-3-ene-1,7-dioic acid hydratase in catechol pathway [Variovorax boronicumulans]MDQ0044573.1 2-keto-4-penten